MVFKVEYLWYSWMKKDGVNASSVKYDYYHFWHSHWFCLHSCLNGNDPNQIMNVNDVLWTQLYHAVLCSCKYAYTYYVFLDLCKRINSQTLMPAITRDVLLSSKIQRRHILAISKQSFSFCITSFPLDWKLRLLPKGAFPHYCTVIVAFVVSRFDVESKKTISPTSPIFR